MLGLENLGVGVGLLVGEARSQGHCHTLSGESTACGLWLRSLRGPQLVSPCWQVGQGVNASLMVGRVRFQSLWLWGPEGPGVGVLAHWLVGARAH